MAFAQLTYRESLRDIEVKLRASQAALPGGLSAPDDLAQYDGCLRSFDPVRPTLCFRNDVLAAPASIPWVWAIDACCSVIVTVLATRLALHLGFAAVVVLAVAACLAAVWVIPWPV